MSSLQLPRVGIERAVLCCMSSTVPLIPFPVYVLFSCTTKIKLRSCDYFYVKAITRSDEYNSAVTIHPMEVFFFFLRTAIISHLHHQAAIFSTETQKTAQITPAVESLPSTKLQTDTVGS